MHHCVSFFRSEAFLEFAVHLYCYLHPNCAWSFERQTSDIAREGYEELLPTGQAILSRYLRRLKDDCDTVCATFPALPPSSPNPNACDYFSSVMF